MQNWLERRHRTKSEFEVFGPTISISRLSHARPAPTAVILLSASASDPSWCSPSCSPLILARFAFTILMDPPSMTRWAYLVVLPASASSAILMHQADV